jgi:chromatin remodeling complex protein RSC6
MSKVTTSIKTTTVPKAKTTKTTKAKVTTESKTVEAPVTAHITAPVTAPVTATVTAPVSTDVTEVPVSTEVTATDAQTTSLKMRFDTLIKSKQDLMNDIKREIQELRKMQRDHEHAVKDASKRSKKKKVVRDESNPRKPSGFASPVVVSDELYKFLEQYGVKHSDPIARTDVTRYITTYIKDKDLQNPEHRREIIPDVLLKTLFGPAMEPKDPNDANSPLVYTYLKLQKYLSAHFPKKKVE